MINNWKKLIMGALVACMPLVAGGCGDGGGSSSPAMVAISGNAGKGPLNGADVFAYKLLSNGQTDTVLLAQTKTSTDNTGKYTLYVPAGTGPVVIVVKGNAASTYRDDVDPTKTKTFSANESMKTTVAPDAASGKFPVANPVTPFTTVAANLVPVYYALPTPPANLQTAINKAIQDVTTQVSNMLGGATINIASGEISSSIYTTALKIFTQYMTQIAAADSSAATNTMFNAIKPGAAPADVTALNTNVAAAVTELQKTDPTIPAPTPVTPITNPDFSDTTPPTVPADLKSIAAGSNGVALSWTASTDAKGVTGYDVYRDGAKIGQSATNTFTDKAVEVGKTYTYTVKAFDAAGNFSAASAELKVTIPATPVGPNLDITVNGTVRP